MGTKTITVTDDAYHSITGLKSEEESFSGLFIRLARERSIADKYFGVLKTNPEELRTRFRKIREELSQDMTKREHAHFRHLRRS